MVFKKIYQHTMYTFPAAILYLPNKYFFNNRSEDNVSKLYFCVR